jgi:hypothetical protein
MSDEHRHYRRSSRGAFPRQLLRRAPSRRACPRHQRSSASNRSRASSSRTIFMTLDTAPRTLTSILCLRPSRPELDPGRRAVRHALQRSAHRPSPGRRPPRPLADPVGSSRTNRPFFTWILRVCMSGSCRAFPSGGRTVISLARRDVASRTLRPTAPPASRCDQKELGSGSAATAHADDRLSCGSSAPG